MSKRLFRIACLVLLIVCFCPLILYACENVDTKDEFVLQMEGDNFKILVLPDIQLTAEQWHTQDDAYHIAIDTVTKLVTKTQPQLIVLLGDLFWLTGGGTI